MIGFKSWTLAIKLSILPLHYVLRRISLGQTEGQNKLRIGSLSNYDDDHNDNFKKNNRFNDQNNSSAGA